MAVATVPAVSVTTAPVRLLCSLAQYAIGMGGNIGKILGNTGQSEAIREISPRPPYRTVGEQDETIRFASPFSPFPRVARRTVSRLRALLPVEVDGHERKSLYINDRVVSRASSVFQCRVSGVDSVNGTKKNLKRILIQVKSGNVLPFDLIETTNDQRKARHRHRHEERQRRRNETPWQQARRARTSTTSDAGIAAEPLSNATPAWNSSTDASKSTPVTTANRSSETYEKQANNSTTYTTSYSSAETPA